MAKRKLDGNINNDERDDLCFSIFVYNSINNCTRHHCDTCTIWHSDPCGVDSIPRTYEHIDTREGNDCARKSRKGIHDLTSAGPLD